GAVDTRARPEERQPATHGVGEDECFGAARRRDRARGEEPPDLDPRLRPDGTAQDPARSPAERLFQDDRERDRPLAGDPEEPPEVLAPGDRRDDGDRSQRGRRRYRQAGVTPAD